MFEDSDVGLNVFSGIRTSSIKHGRNCPKEKAEKEFVKRSGEVFCFFGKRGKKMKDFTISNGYGNNVARWFPQILKKNGKKMSNGVQFTFMEMIKCAAGKDHTFVNIGTLAERTNVCIRTQ